MVDQTDLIDEPSVDHVVPHRWIDDVLGPDLDEAFAASSRLTAWVDAQRLRLAAALIDTGRSPMELLDGVHDTTASLTRLERRAHVATLFPTFAAALERGDVSTTHLDRLGDALRRLLPHERDQLTRDATRLLAIATASTGTQFARHLAREVSRFERSRPAPEPESPDGEPVDPAEARFAAQQAGIRLSSQLDRDTGMTIYRWVLDPLRSLSFDQRLSAIVEALHHGPPIPGCPTDPLERQAFLRAHALLLMLDGQAGAPAAGAEIIVVVDHTTPDGTPDTDWGRPVDIPQRVLDDLFGHPSTHVVEIVVRNGVVVTAPGRLDLGRTTRLANRAQRRALRALYRGCGIPGCDITFDRCTIHHIHWWRNGGATDLANLLPLCNRHHHLVHDNGWTLHLGPNRELTVTTPSGRVMSTGPPHRWAA